MTLARFTEDWLTEVQQRCAKRTIECYTITMRKHWLPHFGRRQLGKIRRRDVRAFALAALQAGRDPATVDLWVRVLRACFSAAVDAELIDVNPAVRLGRLFAQKRGIYDTKVPTLSELHALEAVFRRRYPQLLAMFLLLARSGVRIGEARGLEWEDVDLAHRRVTIRRSAPDTGCTKNGDVRDVPLSLDVVAAFQLLPRRCRWVFASPNNRPWAAWWFRQALHRAVKLAGIGYRVTPHRLRHAWASELAADGMPLPTLQRLLGHRGGQMTLYYARHARGPLPFDHIDKLDASKPPGGKVVPLRPAEVSS